MSWSWFCDVKKMKELIDFGKYSGKKSFADIVVEDPSYTEWLVGRYGIQLSTILDAFISNVLQYTSINDRRQFLLDNYDQFMQMDIERQKIESGDVWQDQRDKEIKEELDKKKDAKIEIDLIFKDEFENIYNNTENGKLVWKIAFREHGQEKRTHYKTEAYGIELTIKESRFEKNEEERIVYTLAASIDSYSFDYTGDLVVGLGKLVTERAISVPKNKSGKKPVKECNFLNDRMLRNKKPITEGLLVVKGNPSYCLAHHEYEEVGAIFRVCDMAGRIKTVTKPAIYCKSCNAYFIAGSVFKELRKLGSILCRMVEIEKFITGDANKPYNKSNLKDKSPLSEHGYNVNQQDNLSEEQRRIILEYIIDTDVLSTTQVVSYLQYFIDNNGKKNNMDKAARKWSVDKAYISGYIRQPSRWVKFQEIQFTNHIKELNKESNEIEESDEDI